MVVTLQPFSAKTTRFLLNNRKKHIKNDLLPFEHFSKKFCLNISELGLEIV